MILLSIEEKFMANIEQVSMKEAFGGEVAFTSYLGSSVGRSDLERLFEKCFINMPFDDVIVEANTSEGKRIDLVVKGDKTVTIECQDASGYLDANHVGKAQFYAFAENADYNLLLCEGSNELVREYARYENLHPSKSNFVVEFQISRCVDSQEHFIHWFVAVLPPDHIQKKKATASALKDAEQKKQRWTSKLSDIFKGSFPLTIKHSSKGTVATVEEDGRVTIEGKEYLSLNQATNSYFNLKNSVNVLSNWEYKGFPLTTYQMAYERVTLDEIEKPWRKRFHPDNVEGFSYTPPPVDLEA